MIKGFSVIRGLILLAPLALMAGSTGYSSLSIDAGGQLHIVLDTGTQILPRKIHGQVAFGEPLISPDHQTVGWLVEYPNTTGTYVGSPLAGAVVLYRNGHTLHTLFAGQVIWDWQFQAGGKRVAYSTGPTHGGATECVLRDAASGRVLARWPVAPEGNPPAWASTLRR